MTPQQEEGETQSQESDDNHEARESLLVYSELSLLSAGERLGDDRPRRQLLTETDRLKCT